jgi:long-chain acyl-CoA synthetase
MNLTDIFEMHLAGDTALVEGERRVSYGELRELCSGVRGGLRRRGVAAGDRVAILADNSVDTVVAYFAIVGLGAVAVPLNPSAPAAELAHQVAVVGATLVVGAQGSGNEAASIAATGTVTVSELLEAVVHGLDDVVEVGDDHLAVLMFTSGTAGAPRAAMLSHGNLLANVRQSAPVEAIGPRDVILGLLPLHHIFGLNVALGLALNAGASIVLSAGFDEAQTLALVVHERVTVIPGVPTIWTAWAHMPQADRAAFTRVRLALSGAAALSPDVARLFAEHTGVEIREGYGLTEASPVVTTSLVGHCRPGSIGRVVAGVEVRLVDDDGGDALAGDPGEIWVKGPNVFQGYWQDPDATARVLTPEGWLRTGDIAVVDDDGYLYLVDRSKDLIIVSGFNVYPAEVEDALVTHAGVAEVAVVGVPDTAAGEAVRAFVVRTAGAAQVSADELRDHCRTLLARYKCPSQIVFVDELPKGLGGKVLRRLLR